MGQASRLLRSIDFEDIACVSGFACIVGGVAWRYDVPLALIVLGAGLLLIGAVSTWRRA
jgi:hypothetical protein